MLKREVLIHGIPFTEIISKEQLEEKIELIVQQLIDKKFQNPTFVITLKGAFMFASEIIKRVPFPCTIQIIQTSSYIGMRNNSTFKMAGLENLETLNQDVILIEDIVDTGKTLNTIIGCFQQLSLRSFTSVTLLRKPNTITFPVQIDLCGFDIEDKFVVGFGLDFDELGRNLQGIYQKK